MYNNNVLQSEAIDKIPPALLRTINGPAFPYERFLYSYSQSLDVVPTKGLSSYLGTASQGSGLDNKQKKKKGKKANHS